MIIGRDTKTQRPVHLDDEARSRSSYDLGVTGSGKTTLILGMAQQDMQAGHGFCNIDNHGDMTPWLLERVPKEREGDVILFEPAAQEAHPLGFNLLTCDHDDPQQVRWVISSFLEDLKRMNASSWGPRLEHVLNYALWTVMAKPGTTILELYLLLTDKTFRDKWVKQLDEPLLINFWKEFPKTHKLQLEYVNSTINKLTPFLLDESMRFIVGQSTNAFDIDKIMNERKILLVNIAKGDMGEHNSRLLGSLLVNQILMAALRRREMPPEERKRRPFHLFVDEFQNFASDSFSILQTECRKMGVDVVTAHQHRDQLVTDNLKGSALNVGNFFCFRVTGTDAVELATQFDNTPPDPDKVWDKVRVEDPMRPGEYQLGNREIPVAGPQRLYSDVTLQRANELANQDPYHFQVSIIERDPQNLQRLCLAEYDLKTINPEVDEEASEEERALVKQVYGVANPARAERIRQRWLTKGRPREEVKQEILARTFGRADMANPPQLRVVEAYEIVKDGDAPWLLAEETPWYWDKVE